MFFNVFEIKKICFGIIQTVNKQMMQFYNKIKNILDLNLILKHSLQIIKCIFFRFILTFIT